MGDWYGNEAGLVCYVDQNNNIQVASQGLPVMGSAETGSDEYQQVVTAPGRNCNSIGVFIGAGNAAIISLDGGENDHFYLPAEGGLVVGGLHIPAGAEIMARNADPGNNFSDMYVSIW